MWFNEGRTVKTAQTIGEAEKQYIDVSSAKIDSANNGKLVATTGKLEIPDTGVMDSEFGVQVNGAKLQRTVEMYQWKESCTTDDNDNQRCTYQAVWDDQLINSNNFENSSYQNPSSMPYNAKTFLAQSAKVGKYTLDNELLNQLNANKTVILSENASVRQPGLQLNNNYYTNVVNGTPKIGDIRISFKYNDASNVSVLAVQNNDEFTKFISSNDYIIYKLYEGNLNGEKILQNLTSENNSTKWLLRLIGTLFVVIGLFCMISPLQELANIIPIFGTIFGWVSGVATFILSLGISIVVIALAWLRYRPVLSIGLLAAVFIAIALTKKYKKPKTNLNLDTSNIVSSQNNLSNQNMTADPNNNMNQTQQTYPNNNINQTQQEYSNNNMNQTQQEYPNNNMNQTQQTYPNNNMNQTQQAYPNNNMNQTTPANQTEGINQTPKSELNSIINSNNV